MTTDNRQQTTDNRQQTTDNRQQTVTNHKNNVKRINFHSKISKQNKNFIINFLSKRFDVEITDNYDYYFADNEIYYNKENMQEVFLSNKDAIRILWTFEAVYPDMNLFDYGLYCFDREYKNRDRIISLPLIQIETMLQNPSELDNCKKNISPQDILKEKTAFCNFIYSNGNAHPMRDKIFHRLNEYKHVDSLGSHLKNVEIQDTRYDDNWPKISVELKKKYKFSIASENARFFNYTSEKIMSSMLAKTIPIYWGDPIIGEEFNEESFINIANFDTLDDAIKYIKEVDTNDDLYCEIMSKPWRTPEQIEKTEKIVEEYFKNFYHIFEQEKKDAYRRPRGTWAELIYSNFICPPPLPPAPKFPIINKTIDKIYLLTEPIFGKPVRAIKNVFTR